MNKLNALTLHQHKSKLQSQVPLLNSYWYWGQGHLNFINIVSLFCLLTSIVYLK